MAWRTLLIGSKGHFKLRDRQFVCVADDGERCVAVEELAVVIIDTPHATVSSAVLNELTAEGTAVVFCDHQHTPSGMLLPFHQHSRLSRVAKEQIGWSLPFQKRAWQTIVQQKIRNQAACLDTLDREGCDALRAMVGQVTSGDGKHVEGRAAQYYWRQLFGPGFRRQTHRIPNPNKVNAGLNYGYAVIRAAVARAIVAHGLLPCFGIHHDSELNAYNLADDLVEPLRPIVDVLTCGLAEEWDEQDALTKQERAQLAALTGVQVRIGDESQSVLSAADTMVESLIRAGQKKEVNLLILPQL